MPRPDMVVTDSRWDVFLPDGVSYRTVETNMRIVVEGLQVGAEALAQAGGQGDQLRVSVPMAGVQYSFEKLYANQGEDPARFSVSYASGGGAGFASLLAFFGTALFWAGAFFLVRRHEKIPARLAGTAIATGAVITGLSIGLLGAGGGSVTVSSVIAVIGFALAIAWPRIKQRIPIWPR
jgi:hypothetical protein